MTADNEASIKLVSDMAFDSLYFLGACMQNPEKTVKEIYAETLGKVPGFTPAIMNAGTAILGAYALFVLPRSGLFDEFSKALTGTHHLKWTGFSWTESRFEPLPTMTKVIDARSNHNVLGGIRNGLAHGNFEVTLSASEPKTTSIHIWSQENATSPMKRNVNVSVTDLADFAIRFHDLFTTWQANGKTFP